MAEVDPDRHDREQQKQKAANKAKGADGEPRPGDKPLIGCSLFRLRGGAVETRPFALKFVPSNHMKRFVFARRIANWTREIF